MEEARRTPERRKGRPTVYSGEGYVSGREPVMRRTHRRPEAEETGSRRPRLAEIEETESRRPRLAETEGTESRRPRLTEAEGTGGRKKRLAEAKAPKRRRSAPDISAEASGLQEKLKQRKQRKIRRVFYFFGAIFAVAYIATAVYFSLHFYNGTLIYGIDCSHQTASEVKLEVEDKLSNYVLEIQERQNKTETISADQIGLEYVDNGGIDRMLKDQRAYIWPVMMLLEQEPGDSVSFSYDRNLAQARLNELECMDNILAIAPRDAYIEATDTGFEVVSEVMGTTLDREKTTDVVLKSLDNGEVTVSLDAKGCYVDPEIFQDNEKLQSDAAAMSELAKANITYTFGNETEIVDAALIRDWIVELADGSFVIDDMCVTNYVESLAAKYDTFGLPLDFYTSIGTTVTLSGGDYGWCIDQDATIVALLNALEEGYRGEMEPVYLYSAMSHENQGIGYTYVEICISQQRMWCYEDGNLIVDTPVVTGNPNKGNATPSGGVWAIDAKKRDAILTGEGYTAPVDYWMPFNDDVGIHDMQQRAYFGGSIYLSNGSHGCVNTPYDQVQLIYNAVSIGTPVIVYE